VLREGKVTNYELTALSKTGRMTVVSYNASTFRDAEEAPGRLFAAQTSPSTGTGAAAPGVGGL
jgi:hypothetical protein